MPFTVILQCELDNFEMAIIANAAQGESRNRSFDDLIGAGEHRGWNLEAERLRSLEVHR
jgi:hypothetical protein